MEIEVYVGVGVQLHVLVTSQTDESEVFASRSRRLVFFGMV
jgi:hypothetical protein